MTILDAPAVDPVAVLEGDPSLREQRRAEARRTLDMAPDAKSPPLRPVLAQHGLSLYAMLALGVLSIADLFQAEAFTILSPNISRALGISLGAITVARTLAFLGTILAPLPMAALSQSRGRRALLCITTGVAWSVITLFTGFVTSLIALIAVWSSTASRPVRSPPSTRRCWSTATRRPPVSGCSPATPPCGRSARSCHRCW